jgi:hypothetical protein
LRRSGGGSAISTYDPPPGGVSPIPPPPPPAPLFPTVAVSAPPLTAPLFPSPPPALPPAAPPPPAAKRKRRVGWIITVVLLSLALLGTGTVLVLTLMRLDEARGVIDEQTDLIDEKGTFSAAMQQLLDKASEFDGAKFGTLLHDDEFDLLAARAWNDRWDATAVSRVTADARATTAALDAQLVAAAAQAGTNASGTTYEAVVDSLGRGFVATSIDDADSLCSEDVLGCVVSNDPYTVHIDAADSGLPYMTDDIRTGLTYHEFAHVLQFTNQEATVTPLQAFGGDQETMADCFALTYYDGWKLHHTVWVSDFEYYEVDVGYGYTCDESQRQVIRDWYEGLGYVSGTVSQ